MDIPPYKIHHVLKIYTRRLIERKEARMAVSSGPAPSASGEKRQAVIDRISEQIIHTAERWTSKSFRIKESTESWEKEQTDGSPKKDFTFYVLGPDERKQTHTLVRAEDGSLFQDSEETGES